MKKVLIIFSGLVLVVFLIGITSHYVVAQKSSCTTIKDGVLTYALATGYPNHYLGNELLKPGFDMFGYNYQAHLFNGSYANIYLSRANFPPYEGDDEAYLAENPTAESHWAWPYRNTTAMMKWNEGWLSKMDCNNDGVLDRPSQVKGSGAWLTNHIQEDYEGEDGEICSYSYFVKIVAVPVDAVLRPVTDRYDEYGVPILECWFDADGTEIGDPIWGEFARIQRIIRDSCEGLHGPFYLSPAGPGFGHIK